MLFVYSVSVSHESWRWNTDKILGYTDPLWNVSICPPQLFFFMFCVLLQWNLFPESSRTLCFPDTLTSVFASLDAVKSDSCISIFPTVTFGSTTCQRIPLWSNITCTLSLSCPAHFVTGKTCTMGQNREKHLINSHLINYCPTSEGVSGVSERAHEWAQRRALAKRAVRSKRTSERTSEWPSTSVRILGCSRP